MKFIPAIVDYANRQVDLELLQSVVVPSNEQEVFITNIGDTPKIVTGVEKAIQRYAVLLLSTLGDIKFAPGQGNTLLISIGGGLVQNTGYLNHLFGIGNAQTLRALAADDDDTQFGDIAADERIVAAVLLDSSVDYSTGTILLEVGITTGAGDTLSFVVPVSTAR